MAAHLHNQLAVSAYQQTDAGVKEVNEDCMGILVPRDEQLSLKGVVAVIADGVSTAEAGKEASEACVQSFISDYYSTPDTWTVKTATQKILTALNRWLYGQGQHYIEAHKGYITTLSILILKSNTAHIFHVGDSRVYRMRQGDLEQLTNDHTAKIKGQQAYLTRAMGMDVHLDVDYRQVDIEEGDLFFLSTDGIHDFVNSKDIQSLLLKETHEEACQQLTALAIENGSQDNLTCQVIEVNTLPQADEAEVVKKLSALPFPPSLETGMKIDGYEVLDVIHASQRSQLYRVKEMQSGHQFVMKTPSENYNDDPAYIERFVMESWVGKRVESPHVVSIAEPVKSPNFLYYLTDYIEGDTLAQWMASNPLRDINQVIAYTEQLIKGVRAFHRKEILHQDLKPDNVVIDANGMLKIIDFGSSYIAGVNEIHISLERDQVLGTADYSAPEVIFEQHLSERADQFSIGCMVYEMLTGKLPYGEQIAAARNATQLKQLKYIPAYHHNPHVPVWMDSAIKRAVKINPVHRYDALSELMYDLQHPNAAYLEDKRLPLIERSPVVFWQMIALLLFVSNGVLIWLLANN